MKYDAVIAFYLGIDALVEDSAPAGIVNALLMPGCGKVLSVDHAAEHVIEGRNT